MPLKDGLIAVLGTIIKNVGKEGRVGWPGGGVMCTTAIDTKDSTYI